MACRQPREVAQPGSRDAPIVGGVRTGGELADQRERQQMRQMADRAKAARRGARQQAGSRSRRTASSIRGRGRSRPASVSGSRRQHDLAAAKQRGRRGGGTRTLAARDRVRRHETRKRGAERAARRSDHVLLGAAGVGDDRRGSQMRRDRGEQRRHFADRRGQQHEGGVGELGRPVLVQRIRAIDDRRVAAPASRLARLRPTPTTLPSSPARFSASANEPPISPVPTTTSLPGRGDDTATGRARRRAP